jgi:hypothetical protein
VTVNAFSPATCEYVPECHVRPAIARPGVLQRIGVACGAAGLFLLALSVVAAMAIAVVITTPYFLLRSCLPHRRSAGCTYCRAGLPPSRTTCPGCGRRGRRFIAA